MFIRYRGILFEMRDYMQSSPALQLVNDQVASASSVAQQALAPLPTE